MPDEFGDEFVDGVKQGLTIGHLTAENERLRTALREIRDFGHSPRCTRFATPVYECGCYERSQAEIARDALKEGDDDRV